MHIFDEMRDRKVMVLSDEGQEICEDVKLAFELQFEPLCQFKYLSYEPVEAVDKSAMKNIAEYKPLLIYVSIIANGYWIVERIKKTIKPAPAVVVLDQRDDESNREKALGLGADGFILRHNAGSENLYKAGIMALKKNKLIG